MNASQPPNKSPKKQALSLFFGGLLPVIAFTVIEEKYGVIPGLIAGMIFGGGEVIYEYVTQKKVSTITWIGNGLLIGLGAISLFSSEGIWFKLQPAILEFGMFVFLLASWIMKKPFLSLMIEKQNPDAPEFVKAQMSGMTLRLSFFMLAHAVLATWAAFYWSTEAWAILKGVGLTVSMIVYMILEILWARFKIKKG
ncbi:septation protein IspZ [bacterium]|nr:septation protein IspZ [bacterium]